MLTRTSATPFHKQIEHSLLQAITRGELPPHSRIPSERELMKRWEVSRITVRQALNGLVLKGYLYSVPGKGFFVADRREQLNEFAALLSFSEAARARNQVPRSRVLLAQLIPASQSLAQLLHLHPGAELVELVRLRYLDDVPVGIQKNWLPHAYCQGILDLDFSEASLYSVLREHYGWRLEQGRMTISARLAKPEEAELLGITVSDPVLTVDQVTFSTAQKPIEVSLGIFHPQRYPLSLIQGKQGRSM
jgi:GntR family transcriptional regulator